MVIISQSEIDFFIEHIQKSNLNELGSKMYNNVTITNV